MSRRVELNRELKNRCIKTKKVSITRGVVLSEGKFHVSKDAWNEKKIVLQEASNVKKTKIKEKAY